MKARHVFFFALLFVIGLNTSSVLAQNDAGLTQSDVKHFIDNFPAISSDFEDLQIAYDKSSQQFTLPESVDYLSKIDAVVKKHGYEDYADFATKTAAIMSAYAMLTYQQESSGSKAELEKALAEIDNSEYYTDEQKQQMRDALEQSMNYVDEMSAENEENIRVVKPYANQLKDLVDSL